jgi:hypothetical protein
MGWEWKDCNPKLCWNYSMLSRNAALNHRRMYNNRCVLVPYFEEYSFVGILNLASYFARTSSTAEKT